ncbi:MAG: hypothetical protein H8E17_17255, partial [Deltaproteobacteria bacterium]|nr:hypothetical protein [Deltaproteobacteria bacterium]
NLIANQRQNGRYWNLIHHQFWPGWWVVREAFEDMRQTADKAGILFYVVLLPIDNFPGHIQKGYQKSIVQLSGNLNIHLINLSEAFVGAKKEEKLWTTEEPFHYSDSGNRLVAQEIATHLLETAFFKKRAVQRPSKRANNG